VLTDIQTNKQTSTTDNKNTTYPSYDRAYAAPVVKTKDAFTDVFGGRVYSVATMCPEKRVHRIAYVGPKHVFLVSLP